MQDGCFLHGFLPSIPLFCLALPFLGCFGIFSLLVDDSWAGFGHPPVSDSWQSTCSWLVLAPPGCDSSLFLFVAGVVGGCDRLSAHGLFLFYFVLASPAHLVFWAFLVGLLCVGLSCWSSWPGMWVILFGLDQVLWAFWCLLSTWSRLWAASGASFLPSLGCGFFFFFFFPAQNHGHLVSGPD